jgi:hypothetical protein
MIWIPRILRQESKTSNQISPFFRAAKIVEGGAGGAAKLERISDPCSHREDPFHHLNLSEGAFPKNKTGSLPKQAASYPELPA